MLTNRSPRDRPEPQVRKPVGFVEESIRKYSFCLSFLSNKQGGVNVATQPIHGDLTENDSQREAEPADEE